MWESLTIISRARSGLERRASDGVEGVEEKVRLMLALESIEAGLQRRRDCSSSLCNADCVPDFRGIPTTTGRRRRSELDEPELE